MTQYLIKFINEDGRYTYVDESVDIFGLKGIRLGGVLFDETNIATVSGTNSVTALVSSVSGTLNAKINSVSGASSLRDDAQDLLLQSVSSALHTEIVQVSGNLQGQINAINNDRPIEERFEATSGQTVFSLSYIQFDPAYPMVSVRKNGLWTRQSLTGSLSGGVSGGDWIPLGNPATQIQFLYPLYDGDKVVVREERTGGGGGGGSQDLENLTTDVAPLVNGGIFIGKPTRGVAGVFLRDTVLLSNVYRLEMVSGALQTTLI